MIVQTGDNFSTSRPVRLPFTNMPTNPDHHASLPSTLPQDPFPLLQSWWDTIRANSAIVDPDAMTVATADGEGRPSARTVLCRAIAPDPGYLVFYSNRRSQKGVELAANPNAAALVYRDNPNIQIRVEGPVTLSPDDESDAYWKSRHLGSRLGAWASDQSQPLSSRGELLKKIAKTTARFGFAAVTHETVGEIPRPDHWGGYRIWARHVELWSHGGLTRIHDRARWSRTLTAEGSAGYLPGAWSATRLQP